MIRGGIPVVLLMILAAPVWVYAQAGVAPKPLLDPALPDVGKQVQIRSNDPQQVSTSVDKNGLAVHIKGGEAGYPGITLKPEGGAPWNLGLYGHVEAKVTNTGTRPVNVALRVDNEGDYKTEPWNCEGKTIEPGQTKTIRVYFGHSYGFKPGFKLKPEAVSQVLFFTGKQKDEVAFRVERVMGAGWVGEKIGVDPDRVARKPEKGMMLGGSAIIESAGQIGATGGAKGVIGAGGKLLEIAFAGGKEEAVTFRPGEGLWNLNEQVEVKVRLKNTGKVSVTPAVRVESEAGPTDLVAASAPLAAGEETEIAVPFSAKVPWKGVYDPAHPDPKDKGSWGHIPGTGTEYRSNVTTGVTVVSDKTPGGKSLVVSSIVADCPELKLPEWLGKRPPVEGDWVQTLNEDFDGSSIDLHRWNVHGPNYWDKRMHFSKDQVIVANGMLTLRLEKKRGHHNDDPAGVVTDYAAGQPETSGKWRQRYGYFEIREKQPAAKCMWPGFWMVADGERKSGQNDGMEFDITESQSSWGIHRFNIACHWDGYEKNHKAVGTSSNYVQADKDGFIVVGMLWTPGSVAIYGNGKEIFRWESPRVSDRPEMLILQNEIGGWDNEEVDDAQLPADYVVDYIRVWQRKDLASAEDGPKPNKGGFTADK